MLTCYFRFIKERDSLKEKIEKQKKRKSDAQSMLYHERNRLLELRSKFQNMLCLTDGIHQLEQGDVAKAQDLKKKPVTFRSILKPTPMIEDGKIMLQLNFYL